MPSCGRPPTGCSTSPTCWTRSSNPPARGARTGAEVRRILWDYLDQVGATSVSSPQLTEFAAAIRKVTLSDAPGLFYAYDLPGLPRTNNGRESEFRNLNRRLLRTTGQKGLTKRRIQREGAWELIPPPNTLKDTITAFARIGTHDLWEEQLEPETVLLALPLAYLIGAHV